MKKSFTKFLLLAVVAMVSVNVWGDATPGALKIAFNGLCDKTVLCNNGSSTTITPSIADGVATITPAANGSSYRGDIFMGTTSSTDVICTTTASDKVIAIKFTGGKPTQNSGRYINFEYKISGNSKTYSSYNVTTVTVGDDAICYVDLSSKTLESGDNYYGNITYWKFKIADLSTNADFKVDWIATLSEVPTTETVINDDPSEISGNYVNAATWTGYTTMVGASGAVESASANSYIYMKDDEEVSSKITTPNVTGLVIDGNNHSLKRASDFSGDRMFYANNQASAIKNIVFDGNSVSTAKAVIEVNKSLTLTDVTFKNHNITALDEGIIKCASNNAILNGTITLVDNVANTIYLKKDRRIDDNQVTYTDGSNTVVPSIAFASDFEEGKLVVRNIATTNKSQISTSKYSTNSAWVLSEYNSGSDTYSLTANIISSYTLNICRCRNSRSPI